MVKIHGKSNSYLKLMVQFAIETAVRKEEMATLRKRNKLWQIQIRRVGHKLITKTFPLKNSAEKWARNMEKKLDKEPNLSFRGGG